MCYNKDVSIGSFVVGTGLALLLYNCGDKYDKHISVFFMVVALIQLAEFFMWIDQGCSKINHYASHFAGIVLYLQALVVVSAGYYFNTFSGFITKDISKYIIYGTLLIWLCIHLSKKDRKLCSKETTKGHLEWEFKSGTIRQHGILVKIVYYTLLVLPWLFLKDKVRGILMFSTIFLSLMYFRFNFYNWESLWCFYSVYAPVIFLLFCKYKTINNNKQ
tara:strand:+ start:221 stop:874 length:654 start_codon:yes stop_codon:yes gene_type:complete